MLHQHTQLIYAVHRDNIMTIKLNLTAVPTRHTTGIINVSREGAYTEAREPTKGWSLSGAQFHQCQ